jgi:hypothetical protein
MEDALEREILIQKSEESMEDYFAIASQHLDDNPLQHYMNKKKAR